MASASKVRDVKKRPKKQGADLGSEDEALHVEDLEPPGVSATQVPSLTVSTKASVLNASPFFSANFAEF